MDDKFERWGALAGVVFVVLAVVGAFIAGSPPKLTDPNLKIIKFTKDNQDALRVASYLAGVGLVFVAFFLGVLWTRVRRAEGGTGRLAATVAIGGAATIGLAGIANGVAAYGALHPAESVFTYRFSAVLFGFVGFAILVWVEATSIVIVRTRFLPAWMGWIGMLIAFGWLVGSAGVSTENDTIFVIGFVVFVAWALWILVLSIMLFRSTESAPAAAT